MHNNVFFMGSTGNVDIKETGDDHDRRLFPKLQ